MTTSNTFRTALFGAALALASSLSLAAPTITGTLAGLPGAAVTATISDDVIDYEAAELQFTFDPAALTFLGVEMPAPGSAASFGGLISLATGIGAQTGLAELFSLLFSINAGAAPGVTNILVESTVPAGEPGFYTPDAFSIAITINAVPTDGRLPVAPTLWLVLAAVPLLAAARRRR